MAVEVDVIVVGARVAGAILAARLGQGGFRVLALDRARFPSDTLSTHFFRAPAFRALESVGVFQEVQATAPHLRVNYNAIDGIAFPEPVDRPDDYPFYLCVRRITLDEILMRRLRSTSGVTVREAAKVTNLLRNGDRVAGVVWQEPDGRGEARARVVVGADGLRSFVARAVEAVTEHEEPVRRAMYYAYFRGVRQADGPAAEFHYRGDNLVYCFPCDGDLTLLAASVPIERFGEFRRDPAGRLREELRSMTALTDRLDAAERVGPVLGTGSIPGYLRRPYGPGWALVGDAAMVMDPWSGQGIDQASTHAVFLAQRLADFLGGKMEWEAAMAAYHQERNAFSQKTYLRTCQYGRDLRPMTLEALQRRGLR